MDLEKPYDRVNREALQQVLRMYDINGKLLNGIKSMYDDSLACVRINSGRSQGGVLCPHGFPMHIWMQQ